MLTITLYHRQNALVFVDDHKIFLKNINDIFNNYVCSVSDMHPGLPFRPIGRGVSPDLVQLQASLSAHVTTIIFFQCSLPAGDPDGCLRHSLWVLLDMIIEQWTGLGRGLLSLHAIIIPIFQEYRSAGYLLNIKCDLLSMPWFLIILSIHPYPFLPSALLAGGVLYAWQPLEPLPETMLTY